MKKLYYIQTNGDDIMLYHDNDNDIICIYDYCDDIRNTPAIAQLNAVEDVSSWRRVYDFDLDDFLNDSQNEIAEEIETEDLN